MTQVAQIDFAKIGIKGLILHVHDVNKVRVFELENKRREPSV